MKELVGELKTLPILELSRQVRNWVKCRREVSGGGTAIFTGYYSTEKGWLSILKCDVTAFESHTFRKNLKRNRIVNLLVEFARRQAAFTKTERGVGRVGGRRTRKRLRKIGRRGEWSRGRSGIRKRG